MQEDAQRDGVVVREGLDVGRGSGGGAEEVCLGEGGAGAEHGGEDGGGGAED